jgi:hypothetical protein
MVDLWKRVLKRKREQQLSKARESKDMAEPMDIEVDARIGGVQVYSNSNFEPFALVPPEIRNHIFSFLDYKGVARAARVCKKWHEECDRYANSICMCSFRVRRVISFLERRCGKRSVYLCLQQNSTTSQNLQKEKTGSGCSEVEW